MEFVQEDRNANKTKADVDIFSFGGLIPILNMMDTVDVINHLQGYLHKEGIIKNMDDYKDSLERFVESRGKITGNLQVCEYNLNENNPT